MSISTASVVLSFKDDVVPVADATKAKVFAAAEELGYEPNAAARALNTSKSGVVGIVGGDATHTEAERMRGVRNFLELRGYSIRVLPRTRHGALLSAVLKAHRSGSIDGLILIGNFRQLPHDRLVEMVDEGMPVVTAETEVQDPRVPCVSIASYDGYSTIIRHLIGHGYEHIALLTGGTSARATREGMRAYKDVIAAAGIAYDERYVIEGDWHPSSGYFCMKELFSRGIPIRAVQAGNDMMAIGAIRAIREHGLRVPEDIAVAGFDDDMPSLASHWAPSLTTMEQPFFRLGNEVAALLYDLLQGRQPIWNPLLPINFVPRESCGCKWPDAAGYRTMERCADARALPANSPLELPGQVVSAVFGHAFYMQNKEGDCGIGVKWHDAVGPEFVLPGDVVTVNGRVLPTHTDMMVRDHCVLKTGRTSAPAPAKIDLAQLRANSARGEMLGVLIEVTGKVVAFGSDRTRYATIQDKDGARADVLLMETDYFPDMGDSVCVVGVSAECGNGVPSILAQQIHMA